MSALAHWQAQYAQRSSGAEPAWLRELRGAAWSGFEAHGLPGRRDEDWKYTRLSALERFAPKAPLELAELPTIVPTDGALLVFAGRAAAAAVVASAGGARCRDIEPGQGA